MNVTLTRSTAHKFTVSWLARPDFIQVEFVLGPSLDEAIANATALLALNGMTVEAIRPTPTGNATLEVTK